MSHYLFSDSADIVSSYVTVQIKGGGEEGSRYKTIQTATQGELKLDSEFAGSYETFATKYGFRISLSLLPRSPLDPNPGEESCELIA